VGGWYEQETYEADSKYFYMYFVTNLLRGERKGSRALWRIIQFARGMIKLTITAILERPSVRKAETHGSNASVLAKQRSG
jgi:hypothetical protein